MGIFLGLFSNIDCFADDFDFNNFAIVPETGDVDITAEDVALYPNPVVTNCVVEAPVGIISIVIINDNGQIVRTLQDVNSTKVTLDVNDLSTGNYFIQIAVPQGNIVKKLLKM